MSSEDAKDTEISSNPLAVLILLLFGIIILVYMFSKPIKDLFNVYRVKLQTVLMAGYWRTVTEKHKEDLDKFFQPLHNRKKELSSKANEPPRNLDVLEIGIGDGANFPYYPDGCNVYALDPENTFETVVVNNIKKYPNLTFKKYYLSPAEDMSFIETGSLDAVISTMCLCTVEDVEKVLSEIKRVLRKNGVFIFWEHVVSASTTVKMTQYLFNGLWGILFGNCHLTRRTWETVESVGFAAHKYSKIKVDTMPLISSTLIGTATK